VEGGISQEHLVSLRLCYMYSVPYFLTSFGVFQADVEQVLGVRRDTRLCLRRKQKPDQQKMPFIRFGPDYQRAENALALYSSEHKSWLLCRPVYPKINSYRPRFAKIANYRQICRVPVSVHNRRARPIAGAGLVPNACKWFGKVYEK
jgi:hypothetical protein